MAFWLGKAESYTAHIIHSSNIHKYLLSMINHLYQAVYTVTKSLWKMRREELTDQTPKHPKYATSIHNRSFIYRELSKLPHVKFSLFLRTSRSSRCTAAWSAGRDTRLSSPFISPDLFNAPPLLPRIVAIALCPLVPFTRQAAVNLSLDVVAVP